MIRVLIVTLLLASCGGENWPEIVYVEHVEPPPGVPVRLQNVQGRGNLYIDLNNEDQIKTRDCVEAVWWDSARLVYNPSAKDYPGTLEFRNKIIFSNKVVCEVLDVTGKIGD